MAAAHSIYQMHWCVRAHRMRGILPSRYPGFTSPDMTVECRCRLPAPQAKGGQARARGRVGTRAAVIFSLVLPNVVTFGNLHPLVFCQ